MKNKNVVVVYWSDDWQKEKPMAQAEATRKSFEDWHRRGLKQGVNMYRASIKWFDEEKNVFKKGWAFRNGEWNKINKPIKPDLIFDKITSKRNYKLIDYKIKVSQKIKIFNNPTFRTLLDNKLSQYMIFSEFMPKSFFAEDKVQLIDAVDKITTEKVVVKPLFGSGGFGIKIKKKLDIIRCRLKYPVLVQEFIPSSRGIPGFSKMNEVSDLRLVFTNKKLIYSLSRRAKGKSLFTNFHQGAEAVIVPRNKIPKSALAIAKKINKKLDIFHHTNYCLDFMFSDSEKVYLVEINTTPGFDLLHILGDEGKKQKNFNELTNILG